MRASGFLVLGLDGVLRLKLVSRFIVFAGVAWADSLPGKMLIQVIRAVECLSTSFK